MHYSDYCTAYSVPKCEKIDLTSRNLTWKALPDMKESKCGFNPCLFHEFVYLCGYKSDLVEAFAPQTESFMLLSIQLPESSYYCLYVHNNRLVVHSYNYITQFSAEQAGQLSKHSQVRCCVRTEKWGNCQPVLDLTRSLFFIFQEDTCYCFSMETGDRVR